MNYVRIILILVLNLLLSGCDNLEFDKKNLYGLDEIVPKIKIDSPQKIMIDGAIKNPFADKKQNLYSLTKYQMVSRPAIAGKIVYSLGSDSIVTAYSLNKKKILWKTNINDRYTLEQTKFGNKNQKTVSTSGGITFSNQKLYISNGSKYLIVLDAKTGIEEFRKYFADSIHIKPFVTGENNIIIQTAAGKTFCIDQNYNIKWLHEGTNGKLAGLNTVEPLLYNDNVIITYSNGEIFCLDAQEGTAKWRYMNDGNGLSLAAGFDHKSIVTQPIIDGDFMYFATANNKIIRLYLFNGLPVWQKNISGVQEMTMYGENIIVTTNARQVAILQTDEGDVIWSGNLKSEHEKRSKNKLRSGLFLPAFVSVHKGVKSVNVASDDGILYQFDISKGQISSDPTRIIKIPKGAKYQWFSCCSGLIHFITSKKISQ